MRTSRRIRTLAILELVNIPLWGIAWFGVVGLPATAANLAGFAAFAALLVQGAAYWLLKLAQLRARRRSPVGIEVFRVLRIANLPLLGTVIAFTTYAAVAGAGRIWPAIWLGSVPDPRADRGESVVLASWVVCRSRRVRALSGCW